MTMSRTWGGLIFTCKYCVQAHLIPNKCKPDHSFKTIKIPCLYNQKVYMKYRGYELKRWGGDWINYLEYLVKPFVFSDEKPKFPD